MVERPYSLNPYQYGYSDPVLNTDPRGTCAKGDGDDPRLCRQERDYLDRAYGLLIPEDNLSEWTLGTLNVLFDAIGDFRLKSSWSQAAFKRAMGQHGTTTTILMYAPELGDLTGTTANSMPIVTKVKLTWQGTPALSGGGAVVVHELAHVWDFAHGKQLSQGMMADTGGSIECTTILGIKCFCGYHLVGRPASFYGATSPEEDWADAVMSIVSPSQARVRDLTTGKLNLDLDPGQKRKKYVYKQFDAYR
jgi:hypothetical protein